jgi:hypothetical protein
MADKNLTERAARHIKLMFHSVPIRKSWMRRSIVVANDQRAVCLDMMKF